MAGFLACAFAVFLFLHDQLEGEDLPVIQEFTNAYRVGMASLESISTQAIDHFYEKAPSERLSLLRENLPGSSLNSSVNNHLTPLHIASSWDRLAIERKLEAAGFKGSKKKGVQRILDYIEKHQRLALQDMRSTNILASIKLAQAILESGAGRSKLAKATNNHFGIKAVAGSSARKKIREGHYGELQDNEFIHQSPAIGAYRFHDDHRYDRFEVYETVGDSYLRHNQLLTRPCQPGKKGCYSWIWATYRVGDDVDITEPALRYQRSSGIAPEDFFNGRTVVPYYAAAAAALKMTGYATSPTYHKKLFYLIETYELWRFDFDLIAAVERSKAPSSSGISPSEETRQDK
ncbi:MAG: glucosaminidase domain-containing protein [Saprospiraceae bacterium]|nr:glucosaminidase domain-containing protein [Lewinella sp.]